MPRVYSALVVTAVTMLAFATSVWPRSAVLDVPATDERSGSSRPHKFEGVASCAALACHHGNGPRGSKGSEYTTWAIYDPHAKAYEVLLNDRSRGIQERLNRAEPENRRVAAENNALCLKCHATPPGNLLPLPSRERVSSLPLPFGERAGVRGEAPATYPPPPTPLLGGGKERQASHELVYGVGCESCHGPAEQWRADHYSPLWKERTDKQALGFRNTKDLAVRAAICAECHVGAPDKEVNHDLIAAGHPRLQFEFAAYLANYPKHWNADDDKTRHADHEARAWVMGQIVSSAAALRLLEARAENAARRDPSPPTPLPAGERGAPVGGRAPWPELAEYDCFACHHDLAPDGWRQKASYLKQRSRPGSLLPSAWYLSMPPILGSSLAVSMKLPLEPLPLGDLRRAMSNAVPNTTQVAGLARKTASQLEEWLPALAKIQLEPATIKEMLHPLEELSPGDSWDAAVQRYLMARALNQELQDSALEQRLDRTSRELTFPPNHDSPRSFNPFTVPDLKPPRD